LVEELADEEQALEREVVVELSVGQSPVQIRQDTPFRETIPAFGVVFCFIIAPD
jgi:hypothetical protein